MLMCSEPVGRCAAAAAVLELPTYLPERGVESSAGNYMVLNFSRCRRWNRGCRGLRRN